MIPKMLLPLAISHMKTDLYTMLGLLRILPHPSGLSQSPLGTPKPTHWPWRKILAESEALSLLPHRSAGLSPAPRMDRRVFLQPYSCHLVLFLVTFWHQLATCLPRTVNILLQHQVLLTIVRSWEMVPVGKSSARPGVTLGSQLLVP